MRMKIADLRMGKTNFDRIFLNQYLMENGKENRKITNTPHYKLLRSYENNRLLDLKDTDYYKWAMTKVKYHKRFFGCDKEGCILNHMRRFLKLYDEVKDNGFKYSRGKIIVFKSVHNYKKSDKYGRPHPPTETYVPEDYEIVEGHHRAAILAALGYEDIEVEFHSRWTVLKNALLKKYAIYRGKWFN